MNLHQVLTGAANDGDRCFAVGSIDCQHFTIVCMSIFIHIGNYYLTHIQSQERLWINSRQIFTTGKPRKAKRESQNLMCLPIGLIGDRRKVSAYAAGSNIVILDGQFYRVQIISGTELGYTSELTCITCCRDFGKIAASYGNKIRIFEPAPVVRAEGKHTINYQWSQTSLITLECDVIVMTWNCYGSRLLTSSGDVLQMWEESDTAEGHDRAHSTTCGPTRAPEFFIGEAESSGTTPVGVGNSVFESLGSEAASNEWTCMWMTKLASPVVMMKFSSDGSLFATAGKNDRLVKIWYENVKVSSQRSTEHSVDFSSSGGYDGRVSFSFMYVAHPRSVTGFSWRQTSRYIQGGILANVLLTSCKDAICRIWSETFLPDDGLLDSRQLESLPSGVVFSQPGSRRNSHFSHKHRLVQRLAHIRKMLQKKKRRQGNTFSSMDAHQSSSSDAHKHAGHLSDVAMELHFHLAATIDFGADIPTIGSFSDGCCPTNFVTHWLNNKEFHTNLLVENLLEEMWKKSSAQEATNESGNATTNNNGGEEPEVDPKQPSNPQMPNTGSDPALNEKHVRMQRLNKAKTFVSMEGERPNGTNHHHLHHSSGGSSGGGGGSSGSSGGGTAQGAGLSTQVVKESESDQWENHIDHMIRSWNETSDVLFSIHPSDGSLLIWTVHYLDEVGPGVFRQAQVSFNSRLPKAFPAYDASTMLASPCVYYESSSRVESHFATHHNMMGLNSTDQQQQKSSSSLPSVPPSLVTSPFKVPSQSNVTPLPPMVLLLSKHSNGSLNLWDICFTDESKFSNAVGVTHVARVCGHRYHTNSAICHPVLPLLLTTSHLGNAHDLDPDIHEGGYCSELILWQVDPIGPLSRSGGINELARVNSSVCSAFADVAWIPSLLPVLSFGSQKTSPSSLFIASNGATLRVYQAVFDARSLLANMQASLKKEIPVSPTSSDGQPNFMNSSFDGSAPPPPLTSNAYNIISHQSTSRPGCIIDLLPIEGTERSWHQIQLMHIFQERMVTGQSAGSDWTDSSSRGFNASPGGEGAFVDFQDADDFKEKFYLVVLQKLSSPVPSTSSSQPISYGTVVFTYEITVSFASYKQQNGMSAQKSQNNLDITSKKVCQQLLPLPAGVSVTSAAVAVGHLSSSSIYPACFAPYLISTACSNGEVYFWKCKFESDKETDGCSKLVWKQWKMMSAGADELSSIQIGGQLLFVSCAYSGRVAVAYKVGGSVSSYSQKDYDSQQDYLKDLFSNLKVAIYQCEATGGSEWTLEDTIPLKTITLPDLKYDIDPHFLYDFDKFTHQSTHTMFGGTKGDTGYHHISHHHHYPHPAPARPTPTPPHFHSHGGSRPVLPSCTSLHNLKRALSTKSPKLPSQRSRPFVFLDWISAEDGSHILTVGVGSQIILYGPASLEMACSIEARDRLADASSSSFTASSNRGKLQKSMTMVIPNKAPQVIRWIKLRMIELYTADGLAPFPVHISWVRSGILVVGMDNEMHVFSQWPDLNTQVSPIGVAKECCKSGSPTNEAADTADPVSKETNALLPRNQSLVSVMTKSMSTAWLVDAVFKDPMKGTIDALNGLTQLDGQVGGSGFDEIATLNRVGLFEAARLACPSLPQYHPRQLLELLNFGKVKRVKAILWHLLRCITEAEGESGDSSDGLCGAAAAAASGGLTFNSKGGAKGSSKDGIALSSGCFGQVSIAPLPLYALLAADEATPAGNDDQSKLGMTNLKGTKATSDTKANDYDALFSMNLDSTMEDDPFIDLDPDAAAAKEQQQQLSKMAASSIGSPGTFGPTQAQLLSRHLTRSSLPGMSSLDQMYLLALAETVANTKLDFVEGLQIRDQAIVSIDTNFSSSTPGEGGPMNTADSVVDNCGLRYLLAARHHIYLINSLPMRQRVQLQKTGLGSSEFVWAFHSNSQEELLNSLPCMQKGSPTWAELKQFGVGWWLRNINSLSRCIEKVAKSAFQVSKDPLDSALFYLAMKKKNVLWGLFRSVDDSRMAQFFRNNFSEDRWRRAALKNAFALIGKQKFHCAAAFFLLGGAIKDAVEVCLKNLDDIQLAMVVLRLYEGDLGESSPPAYRNLLLNKILGGSLDPPAEEDYEEMPDSSGDVSYSQDPFLRSMAYWILNEYSRSLSTLLQNGTDSPGDGFGASVDSYRHDKSPVGGRPPTGPIVTSGLGYAGSNLGKSISPAWRSGGGVGASSAAMSSVFNFYIYLRTHPLILRHQQQERDAGRLRSTVESRLAPVDCITTTERRLYFMTAHEHFKNGCPALALEVLIKLPPYICPEEEEEEVGDGKDPVGGDPKKEKKGEDVSAKKKFSFSDSSKSTDVDWSQPVSSTAAKATEFDWSQSLAFEDRFGIDDDDELELDFGADSPGSSDNESESGKAEKNLKENEGKVEIKKTDPFSNFESQLLPAKQTDIMAQQLKFVACLRMIADELATLAAGFGVDGGQLRFHLYYWLEKEVEVLKKVCQYYWDSADSDKSSDCDRDGASDNEETFRRQNSFSKPELSSSLQRILEQQHLSSSPTALHEVMAAENQDFNAKHKRLGRRHAWLRTNHNLLVTLLSYTILHGSSGGGFASVRTEILLLLQELQEKNASRRQGSLVAPLPIFTHVPLLTSSLASSRTVVADLIQYLQNMSSDLLSSFSDLQTAPDSEYPQHKVYYIFSIGAALSACIYQSLSDNDSFVVMDKKNTAMRLDEFFSSHQPRKNSHLMGGIEGKSILSTILEPPKTEPAKWPGVGSLALLMKQNKDDDLPQLNILLLESLLSVYLSLLCYALASYDVPVLGRLVGRPLSSDCWGTVFGGGVKQLIKIIAGGSGEQTARLGTNSVSKHRVKLAETVIGPQVLQQRYADTRPTYQERFVPPKMSIIDYFLTKVSQQPSSRTNQTDQDPDSRDSESSQDEEDDEGEDDGYDDDDFGGTFTARRKKEPKKINNTHLDPRSFPWHLMRYAVIRYVNIHMNKFLPAVGCDLSELAHTSPKLNAVIKNLSRWEAHLKKELDDSTGTLDIPGLYVEPTPMFASITVHKYSSLMDPQNTPFQSKNKSAKPMKRLWHALVSKEQLQDIFIRYAFKTREQRDPQTTGMPEQEPMKVIHKDQDTITSFAVNQTGLLATMHVQNKSKMMHLNCLVMSTHKEIIEVDMSQVIEPPDWLQHDIDYDVELIKNPMSHGDRPEDFLLLRSPYDGRIMDGALGPSLIPDGTKGASGPTTVIKGISIPGITNPSIFCYIVDRSRRLMRRILKRPDTGVRRLAAHPLLPFYVSGADDGCVKLWEWGQPSLVAEVRKSGAFPKVTMVAFNDQGNKIGISDVEGSLCLWQVGAGITLNKPYLSMKCHNKTTNGFSFVGCSSLLCTAGHSADNRNVALWDTLLPQRKMLVQSFLCHADGCPAVVYAPSHQVLISGGKKGEICIFDVRQRQLRHTFQAHNSAVKCLTLDNSEEFFVSGAADGDIKVWSLTAHNLLHSFTAEHSKVSSNLFRNATSGVIQVTLNSKGHLFSCGNDGTMKIRRLFNAGDKIAESASSAAKGLLSHPGDIVQTWNKSQPFLLSSIYG